KLSVVTAIRISAIPRISKKPKDSLSKIIEKNSEDIASSPAINDPFTGPIILIPARNDVKARTVPIIVMEKSAKNVIKSKSTLTFQGLNIIVSTTPPINIPKPVTTTLEYFLSILSGSIEYKTT